MCEAQEPAGHYYDIKLPPSRDSQQELIALRYLFLAVCVQYSSARARMHGGNVAHTNSSIVDLVLYSILYSFNAAFSLGCHEIIRISSTADRYHG